MFFEYWQRERSSSQVHEMEYPLGVSRCRTFAYCPSFFCTEHGPLSRLDLRKCRPDNHVWLGGITWKLASSERRIVPFLQPLAGNTRASSAGTIQHNFTFQLAGGVGIKLKRALVTRIDASRIYPDAAERNAHQ
jgi:hypothetical protein